MNLSTRISQNGRDSCLWDNFTLCILMVPYGRWCSNGYYGYNGITWPIAERQRLENLGRWELAANQPSWAPSNLVRYDLVLFWSRSVAAPEYWKNGNEHKPKLQVSDYFNMMKVFKLHRPNGPIPQSELRYSIIMTQSMFSGREHRLCHNLGTPCNERHCSVSRLTGILVEFFLVRTCARHETQ